MTHVTCRLTAKNRDQLRNPTLGNRVWATFTFLCCVDIDLPKLLAGPDGPADGARDRLRDIGAGERSASHSARGAPARRRPRPLRRRLPHPGTHRLDHARATPGERTRQQSAATLF